MHFAQPKHGGTVYRIHSELNATQCHEVRLQRQRMERSGLMTGATSGKKTTPTE